MAQVGEEPPFLTVGTEVSAKYRGAFCEASIKSVKKVVKCKVTFSKTNGSVIINDDCIKGTLKVGTKVEAKYQDGQFQEAIIVKLTDASVYTVVFDDGDERTLRRTSLCLKGERHFNVSETLDHQPLTDPENFGTPVMKDGKKRKKRRLSQAVSMEDSETEKDDGEPPPSKKKSLFNDSIVGKVVVVENHEKKKHTSWFPGLGVSPNSSDSHLIKTKDQCLVRSFKDGKYHVINVKNTKKFARNTEPVSSALKGDNRTLKLAIERALSYEGTGKVPVNWEDTNSSNGEEAEDEETSADLRVQRAFSRTLFAFMEERGTPIIRSPVLGNQDLNLHKLYNLVKDIGGMDKVSSPVQWRTLYSKMDIPAIPPSASHHIKMAYKKYLYPYEMYEKGIDVTVKDTDSERSNDDKASEESGTGRSSRNSLRNEEKERQNEAKQVDSKVISKESEKTKRHENEELEVEVESDVKSPESEVAVDVVNSPGTVSDESDQTSESQSEDGSVASSDFTIGDKIQVKYGRGRNHRLYEAKIISTDTEADEGLMYCVHYAGWNNRYDEWIKPERISGIGSRQTRKRSTSISKEVAPSKGRRSPPKPVPKPTPKVAGKKNSKCSLPVSSPKTSVRNLAANGSKGTRRGGSPSRRSDSPSSRKSSSPALGKSVPPVTRNSSSPALGKSSSTYGKSPSPALGKSASVAAVKTPLTSPKSGPGRGRLRTERQNSMPDLRRGVEEEEIKSPTLGGRRRKKSLTPEPTSAGSRAMIEELSPLAQPLPEDDDVEQEVEKLQEEIEVVKEEPAADEADAETKDETKTSEVSQIVENKTELSSEPDENPIEQNGTTSKKREKLKRLNGLILPCCDLESCAPTAKEIKLDNDSELADKEIEDFLKNNTESKSPVESPQTEGSITSGDFSSCSSSDVKLKPEEVESMEAETTSCELKSVKEERSESPNLSSSDKSDAKDKKENHKVQMSADKKNNERHNKRHRGRRDKRKQRLNSGNESTGSDVPPSPGPSSSPFCRPSPGRPRITFDQDLEQIKGKADSTERIRLMQEKIGEMRKIYSSLKAEVASIDRKNKRLRKKREEQAAAAEASDSVKDSKSSSTAVESPSIPAVECR